MQNGATYSPRSDSLPGRMIAFFKANPGELLTLDDIVAKFEPSRGNVHTLLIQARESGLLERKQNDEGEYAYCAGAALPMTSATDGINIDAVHEPAARPRQKRSPVRVEIDLAQVPIAKGVPLPSSVSKKPRDYGVLLDRMVDVGDSAELPLPCRSSLAKAIKAIHTEPPKKGAAQRKFEVRTDPALSTVRVWRTQ